jgi:flagellar biosynthesis protein FlhG
VKKGDEQGPRIVAVGGGKGGTGKSLLAANLGVFLSTLGKRVTLVDAAFGSATLHQFVGVPRPQRTLADMMGNNSVTLDHIAVDAGIPGLSLVAGEGDPAWASNPKSAQINKLISRLRQIDADYVVIDLAAGTNGTTLDLFLIADVGIVVSVPEPTSVELAYRFLRAAFVRRLRKVGVGAATDIPAEELRPFEGGIPSPNDVYERVAETDEGVAERVATEMARFRPCFVVNQVRSKADMELCGHLARAVQRRFGIPAEELGHLEYDDTVAVAVRRRRPLLVEHPESRIARNIERLTRRLLSHDTNELPVITPVGDSFYDLLEIEPSSTEEEIRRAARRIREIYARDSLIMGALYNKARLDDMHLRIDEAYETLMDPVSRKAYDQALFPGGIPKPQRREESDAVADAGREAVQASGDDSGAGAPPLPPRPDLPPNTDFTGQLMREVRESMGVDLRAISERTKIGMGYLTAIETETFVKLPAVVYVRGFLVQYARLLKLDESRLLATYLERYRKARAELDADDS